MTNRRTERDGHARAAQICIARARATELFQDGLKGAYDAACKVESDAATLSPEDAVALWRFHGGRTQLITDVFNALVPADATVPGMFGGFAIRAAFAPEDVQRIRIAAQVGRPLA